MGLAAPNRPLRALPSREERARQQELPRPAVAASAARAPVASADQEVVVSEAAASEEVRAVVAVLAALAKGTALARARERPSATGVDGTREFTDKLRSLSPILS